MKLHINKKRVTKIGRESPIFVNYMGDEILDDWQEGEAPKLTIADKHGKEVTTDMLDILATQHSDNGKISIAIVNKDPEKEQTLSISLDGESKQSYSVCLHRITGKTVDSYNDIDRNEVFIEHLPEISFSGSYEVVLAPHSVNVIDFVF